MSLIETLEKEGIKMELSFDHTLQKPCVKYTHAKGTKYYSVGCIDTQEGRDSCIKTLKSLIAGGESD